MIPHEFKLLDMLSNNDVTFYIPPYQRNYEWTSEQCNGTRLTTLLWGNNKSNT